MNGGVPATPGGQPVVRWNATRYGIDFPAPVVPGQKSGQDRDGPRDEDTRPDSGRVHETHYALDRFPTPRREKAARLLAMWGKRKSVTQHGDKS